MYRKREQLLLDSIVLPFSDLTFIDSSHENINTA